MSSKVTLVELVLDNLLNIKDVVNSTDDIEHYLSRLKLDENVKDTSGIFDKLKDLVDGLYNHSAKIKDLFYKHYSQLETAHLDEEGNKETSDDLVERDVEKVSHREEESIENINNKADKNTSASESKECGTTVEKASELEADNNRVEENNDTIEENRSIQPDTEETYTSTSENTECDATVDKTSELEVDNTNKELVVDSTNNVDINERATESDSDPLNNNIAAKSKDVNTSLERQTDRMGCNGIRDLEINNDNVNEETNDSEIIIPNMDPLEIREESPDVSDNNILDSNKKETDIGNKSVVDDNEKGKETTIEIKKEPRIRLVDLSKLIDPKPKKSVKFDSSVIILTSSDEETKTPKKKNDIKDPNTTLKSALKSPSDSRTRSVQEDEKHLRNERSKRNESESEESSISLSDSEALSSKKTKTKELKKSENRKSLTEKNKDSSDSDGKTSSEKNKAKVNKSKHCSRKNKENSSDTEKSDDSDGKTSSEKNKAKVNKSKHRSRKNKENSSDTEKSDDEPSKKKKKTIKDKKNESKKYSSDSSDCAIQDEFESEKGNKKSREDNSRRSSRLHSVQNQKQKDRERMRKVFGRVLNKSPRSNFRAVNKKLADVSDSDSDTDNTSRKLSQKKKNNKVAEHISDTSSLSDDENEDVDMKERSKKNKKRKQKNLVANVKDKFSYAVYIPLPRIKCGRLKEIYLKNKEIFEIKSLRNINLSRSKRSRETKGGSNSSSDTEKPKSKKSKNVVSTKPVSNDEESFEEALKDVIKKGEDLLNKRNDSNKKSVTEQEPIGNEDGKMAEIDTVKDSDDDKKDEENSRDSENQENTSKDAGGKKKKTENNNKNNDRLEDKENKSDKVADKKKKAKINKESSSDSEDEKDKSEDVSGEKKRTEENSEEREDEQKDKTTDEEEKKSEDESNEEINKDDEKKESDDEPKKSKEKLPTIRIDSSDSEEEFSKFCKKKDKSRDEIMRKTKKRAKKAVVSSDSDNSTKGKDKNNGDSSDESENSDEKQSSNGESEEEVRKKSVRKRIRSTKGSSSSSDDDKSTRKHIRRLIDKDSLSETTKQAEAEEKERKARIAEKQKKYNQIYENTAESKVEKLVLDYDEKGKNALLTVHKKLVKKLKPHQASGIQFMWDACFESLERAKSTKGSGCILAHCMGLGKTLQVIALAHTLLTRSKKTGVEKILVVCPVNTVLNWKAEFKKWLPRDSEIEVYELTSCKQNYERQHYVNEWHSDGGVLIIGYTMFRNLSNPDNKRISKKMRTAFSTGLVDPGPDLVVCDEGHLLKNEKTNLSIAMNRIRTARRIVLTGTPLQNNLKEYWCMVQFIKPNLLGNYKEYLNRFVNPIINGQYTDSTQHDILVMRKRSHVLHKLLDGVVQRRDYGVLEPYLPPKHEYVLFVMLSETQVKMYQHYMDRYARRQSDGTNRTSYLFTDFQMLQRICTHPRVMLDKTNEKREKEYDEDEDSEGSLKDFIDDGEESASSSNSSSSKSSSDSGDSDSDKNEKKKKGQKKMRVTRAQAAQRRENNEMSDPEVEEVAKEWWQEYCDGEELDNINNSGKLFLLFQILKECEEIGDKVLVFSQSLIALNCIEYFLDKIDSATQAGTTEKVGGHSGSWAIGLDYFRLDGSSSCDNRASWCDQFNNPDNTRARLFLISTKAGGLGINLVAANRVIIFDVSWNPSHDIQSIYRVYRFGQTKPCYIYRFVTYGTMEMKIYERQVTKQAISKRVIDEQQIDRHYNQNDLQELYQCDLKPADRPIPLVPKDVLLGELLQKYDKTIYRYHLHQSLLENKEEEGLNEEERKAAWEEFENEKVLRKNTGIGVFNNVPMNAQTIAAALASIVRKDNPSWSEVQIKGIIPALVQQLQVQLSEGDTTMYTRVQHEIQLMQALQAQKLKEAYFQQQVMRMIQHQQQQAKSLGNMNIDPRLLVRPPQPSVLNNYLVGPPRLAGPSTAAPRQLSNDVIELND